VDQRDKKPVSGHYQKKSMFKEYLKIAWRNMARNKAYVIINIGGLSIGIAVSLLICLYAAHEYSYDRFHKNSDRIYSLYARVKLTGSSDSSDQPWMSFHTGPLMKQADPSVESFVRVQPTFFSGDAKVQNPAAPQKIFTEKPFVFADSNFFSFFSFHLKEGDPNQVLARPFTMVITQAAAKKYFGDADPVGHYLTYDSAYTFEITGVADDAPSNSSISYEFVASLSSTGSIPNFSNWQQSPGVIYGAFSTYLLLKKGSSPQRSQDILEKLAAQNKSKDYSPARYHLLPISSTHSVLNGEGDNMKYLKIFMLAGALIFLLALINYMSLTTARATLRAKEVGVRKVIGANRPAIARQFYTESALYSVIAYTCGLLLFKLAQPYFFNRIQLKIDPSFLYQPGMLAVFVALLLTTILIAGSYPSIVLSSFSPIAVLYGKLSKRRGGAAIRRLFIILQFSICTGMIICTLIIERQMYFFRHTDTGLDRENVLMVHFGKKIGDHYEAFKEEVSHLPGVSGLATAQTTMYNGGSLFPMTTRFNPQKQAVWHLAVDDRFIPLLNIKWLIPPKEDLNNRGIRLFVINQAAINRLNLPANPVGETVDFAGDKRIISGVVKDFAYRSLKYKTEAFALTIAKDSSVSWKAQWGGSLFIKIMPKVNLPTLTESVGKIYAKYDPKTDYSYQFMDEAFNAQYKAEDRLADLTSVFAGLTILIACLGLVGLVAFSATERTREIGIRKVLGASVRRIVFMLTRDFIRYVLIAIIIAIPISLYYMNQWLDNFAYRVSAGWGVCVVTAAITVSVATLVIGFITFRAARANPVENLRTE
jgi:putative ABC transport system permease protein